MGDLAAFILARIEEDEERVGRVPDWYCTESARGEGWGSRGDCPLCGAYMFDGTEDVTEQAYWDHLEEAHGRARVLAQCAAYRAIVELHQAWGYVERGSYADNVLRALASIWAEHESFDPAWRLG